MAFEFLITEAPTAEHRSALLALLQAYNRQHADDPRVTPLTILIHGEGGNIVGGLHADSAYDWLIVELLFVPEAMRGKGVGSSLLARAEQVARARGCVGIWLDTFSFQARGFYERLGYRLFGTVEHHPRGETRYFLKKTFD
jgi:GNAT superfamily N-acetyltransferase